MTARVGLRPALHSSADGGARSARGRSLAALAACAPGTAPQDSTGSATPEATHTDSGEEIPEETNGPFPADGSNGVNVLTESGVVRSDIRSSFGDATEWPRASR